MVAALAERLRTEGAALYHHRHPFHVAMHEGRLTPEQLRGWVANRYYYQSRIPIKDALIVAKSEDRTFRRAWLRRIVDHDAEGGGLDLWERLAEAVGLRSRDLRDPASILPGVRACCDEYVAMVREAPLVAAVASSLTELFAPDLMARRIEAWERHYPWVSQAALDYFRGRVTRARRDGEEALAFVVEHADTPELEEACVRALVRKAELLWELLDSVQAAYGIGRNGGRPRLSHGARLREDRGRSATFVLAPDRAIRLDPQAERIVQLCDGRRSIGEIAAEVAAGHADSDRTSIEGDVQELIARLVARRVLDLGAS